MIYCYTLVTFLHGLSTWKIETVYQALPLLPSGFPLTKKRLAELAARISKAVLAGNHSSTYHNVENSQWLIDSLKWILGYDRKDKQFTDAIEAGYPIVPAILEEYSRSNQPMFQYIVQWLLCTSNTRGNVVASLVEVQSEEVLLSILIGLLRTGNISDLEALLLQRKEIRSINELFQQLIHCFTMDQLLKQFID